MDDRGVERLLRSYYGARLRRAAERGAAAQGAAERGGEPRGAVPDGPGAGETPAIAGRGRRAEPPRGEGAWPSLLVAAAACALIAGWAFAARWRAEPAPLPGLSALAESAGGGAILEGLWEALRPSSGTGM